MFDLVCMLVWLFWVLVCYLIDGWFGIGGFVSICLWLVCRCLRWVVFGVSCCTVLVGFVVFACWWFVIS